MDQSPGPNIARAAPAVPNMSQSHLSPGIMSIFQTSMRATEAPAMGVHKPAINRIPAPSKRMAGIVTPIGGGSLRRVKPARTTSAEPATARIRSNPVPGQPPANVEYSRLKRTHFPQYIAIFGCSESASKAQKGADHYSLELWDWDCEGTWSVNYSSIMPRFKPIIAACVRSLAPSLERMFFTRPLTVSSVIES
jgi:hypothetical protein